MGIRLPAGTFVGIAGLACAWVLSLGCGAGRLRGATDGGGSDALDFPDNGSIEPSSSGGGYDSSNAYDTGSTGIDDAGTGPGNPADSSVPSMCADASPIVVLSQDGGMNTACEACLADYSGQGCGPQACFCVDDTETVPYPDPDSGTMAPGCEVFAACVYTQFITNQQTSDAGAAASLEAAETQCQASVGASMASQDLGAKLIGCMASTCATACFE